MLNRKVKVSDFGASVLEQRQSHYARTKYEVYRYRVIQEERSVFWKVMLSVTAMEKVHANMVLILCGYRDGSHDLIQLDFCLWVWIKGEVYKRNVDTRDELVARILDAAACIKKSEDQLRRTTRDLRTRFATCTEVDGGIFERLL